MGTAEGQSVHLFSYTASFMSVVTWPIDCGNMSKTKHSFTRDFVSIPGFAAAALTNVVYRVSNIPSNMVIFY